MNAPSATYPLASSAAASRYSRNRLLIGIPPEVLAPVLGLIREQVFEAGAIIFEESDWGDAMYLIAEGSVKISKRGRGGLQETLAHLTESDFFGDMALMDTARRSAQASADSRTVLGRVNKTAWSMLLQLAPETVLSNFTRSISQRLRDNNQRFIEEMLRNERLSTLGATVSSIVHDMNNPITCILGACQLLERDTRESRMAGQMVGIILKSVERMEAMTGELLDFARGTTHLSITTISTAALIQELEEQELYKCSSCSVTVEKNVLYEGEIDIDIQRVSRLLVNLAKNAREAMTEGGSLKITVARQGESVVFEVTDTGCGMSPDMQAKVFEPFITFGKKKGTGLGLAIAKAVTEAHKGSIALRSQEGVGTTFEVCLPIKHIAV